MQTLKESSEETRPKAVENLKYEYLGNEAVLVFCLSSMVFVVIHLSGHLCEMRKKKAFKCESV